MKNLFFAALAALTLGIATVPAYAAGQDNLNGATKAWQQGEFATGG
jgi:Na+-driven multidrug efflux pump